MPKNYYAILGVNEDASNEEIKKAFRKLASEHHPDKIGGSNETFKEINEAYLVLSNAEKRMTYDLQFKKPKFSQEKLWEEILKPFSANARSAVKREVFVENPGSDRDEIAVLTIAEAFNGTKKEYKVRVSEECKICGGNGAKPGTRLMNCGTCGGAGFVNDPFNPEPRKCISCHGKKMKPIYLCDNCNGTGHKMKDKLVSVSIPQGVKSNDVLRIPKMGNHGDPPGDLFIKINVIDDDVYRKGNDAVLTIDAPLNVLMLGGLHEFSTPWGVIHTIEILQNTKSGQTMVIDKAGFKTKDNIGNLVLKLNALLPHINSKNIDSFTKFIKDCQ